MKRSFAVMLALAFLLFGGWLIHLLWVGAVVAYAIAALTTARLVAGHVAYYYAQNAGASYKGVRDYPDGEQWTAGVVCGLGVAAVWPALLLWHLMGWKVGAERQAELRKHAKRISELEKEAGLR